MPDGARLWEIAENLHRAELTVLERSDLEARWIVLTEKEQKEKAAAQQPAQVAPPVRKRGHAQEGGGINAAVRDLGIDRTEAQLQRGDGAVKKARSARAASGVRFGSSPAIRARRGLRAQIAREIGLTRAAVIKWDKVPAERLPDVERITGIPRHQLRPDICPPPPASQSPSPSSAVVREDVS